jgi:hypothetical protein
VEARQATTLLGTDNSRLIVFHLPVEARQATTLLGTDISRLIVFHLTVEARQATTRRCRVPWALGQHFGSFLYEGSYGILKVTLLCWQMQFLQLGKKYGVFKLLGCDRCL